MVTLRVMVRTGVTKGWDDHIHREECKRDTANMPSRVVVTWHAWNLVWALQRCGSELKKSEGELKRLAQNAIAAKLSTAAVLLFVHVEVFSVTFMLTKRKQDSQNRSRIPMKDENIECWRLHHVLQVQAGNH